MTKVQRSHDGKSCGSCLHLGVIYCQRVKYKCGKNVADRVTLKTLVCDEWEPSGREFGVPGWAEDYG